jgi:tricarballylate dehydrogenase
MDAGRMAEQFDLIVIGCGAAGLSAAVSYAATAREQGRVPRVAVLERADKENRGGATRWTSAWFRITEHRNLDPGFFDLMEKSAGKLTDLDVCSAFATEVKTTLDFLEANGVELVYFQQPFPNRNSGGGLGMPAKGGLGIVDGLGSQAFRDKTEIFYRTEAVRLAMGPDGGIGGVIVRGRDGLMKKMTAKAVVIACGGFEGSKEMLTQYLGARACELPLVAPTLKNNRGDGIRMAMEFGADTLGQFDMFHGEPMDPRSRKPDAVVYAFPFGIVVNEAGKRFFDEGKDSFDSTFEELSYEIWKNQNQKAFFIGDQTTLGIENIERIILTDVTPETAHSIGELAQKLGIDPAGLDATIAEYNAAVTPGAFDPHVRDGSSARGLAVPKSNWAFPLNSPPFIAYPLTCAITFTFGGIRTDATARVITPGGTAIPGLYAAGEVTGLYYHSYPAGTSVLRAATFGRIAGAHAAKAAIAEE